MMCCNVIQCVVHILDWKLLVKIDTKSWKLAALLVLPNQCMLYKSHDIKNTKNEKPSDRALDRQK